MDEALKSCMGDKLRELRAKHPEMGREQQLAIALSECGGAKAEDVAALYDEIAGAEVVVDASAFAYLSLAADPALIGVQDSLRALFPADADIDWQLPATFHITLAFCMRASDTQIRQAATAVQAVPLSVRGTRLGVFENGDERALHIEVEPTDDLKALQAALYEGFATLGAEMSEFSAPDAYKPHITLAYLPAGIEVPDAPVDVSILANRVVYGRDLYKPYVEITLPSAIKSADRLIAFGGAAKALDGVPGMVGGYLVEFGDMGVRDLQRERFVTDTDFALDWYGERPLLFHHGLNDSVGTEKVGTIKALRRDDKGLWLEAILDERNEYVEYVRKLVDMGVLGLSAGSLPHLVRVDGDGTIKRFPIVEGSLTHTPADPRTRVMSLKTFLSDAATQTLPEPTGQGAMTPAIEVTQSDAPVSKPDEPAPIDQPEPEEKQRMDAQKLIALLESMGLILTDEQKAKLAAEFGGDALSMANMPAEQMKAAVDAAVLKAFTLLQDQQGVQDAFKASIQSRINSGQPQSRVTNSTPQGRGQITDVHDMRFHHLKAQDLVFGAHVLRMARKAGLSEYGVSETFLRAAADKALKAADHANGGYGDGYALKSAIKADEVFSSNLTNYGQNWVGAAYETQMWETVREAPIYKALIDMGVMEVEIPQGFNSIYIPTEGTDPTFYSLAELNDETSDERLPITGKSSNLTATRRQLTPGFIGARVSFTDVMEEDSLIPVLPFLRNKLEMRGQEIIEYLMINGDTETGSTNINYDGSAVSALVDAKGRGPVYAAMDGFLKLALVTTTALSRDGSMFDETDYMSTLKLLPKPMQSALERLAFIADGSTYLATVDFAVNKTVDVRGGAATIVNGRVDGMYGIKLFRSGQMDLADTDGKITYNAAGTKGRLLLVRPDQWALGRKREMRTEVARDIDAQATVVVTTMRFGMTYRSATGGAAVSFDLSV